MRHDSHYQKTTEMQCTSLVFELVDGFVADVELNLLDTQSDYPEFQEFYNAGNFWDALNPQTVTPETVQMFEPDAIYGGATSPWHVGDTGITGADFDTELCAILDGGVPFYIEGGHRQPALVGEPTFDAGNDKWIIGGFKVNPSFNWRDLKVFKIRTLTRNTITGYLNRITHPLSA